MRMEVFMFAFRHNEVCSEQHQTLCLGLRIGKEAYCLM